MERLGEVVLRTPLQRSNTILAIVGAGQHQHGNVGFCPSAAYGIQHLVPVGTIAQLQVEDDSIGRGALDIGERLADQVHFLL